MKRFSDRSPFHPLADINVVPLVDLTFNLLIIFMLATPLLEHNVDMKLAKTRTGVENKNPGSRTVNIDALGRIYVDKRQVDLQTLGSDFKVFAAANPDTLVMVRADKSIPFEKFVEVVDALREAGVKSFGFVTIPASGK